MPLWRVGRLVQGLIILRAYALSRRSHKRPPRRFGPDRQPRLTRRAMIGGHLRRKLKRKTPGDQVAVLISVLRDLDAWAAPVAHRFTRTFSRLAPRCFQLVSQAESPRALRVCAPDSC